MPSSDLETVRHKMFISLLRAGPMPASQIPIGGFPQVDPTLPSSSLPVEVDDEEEVAGSPEPPPVEIESLENSPGNTLRQSARRFVRTQSHTHTLTHTHTHTHTHTDTQPFTQKDRHKRYINF